MFVHEFSEIKNCSTHSFVIDFSHFDVEMRKTPISWSSTKRRISRKKFASENLGVFPYGNEQV